MITSALDKSVVLTEDATGAISILVTTDRMMGHSLVAIEYVHGGVYQNVVADLLPRPHSSVQARASQMDLARGTLGGHALKSRIRVLDDGQSIAAKVKRPFRSRTWQRSSQLLNNALLQIGLDASASHPNPEYDPYANAPYEYRFLGQFSTVSSTSFAATHALNCSNWVRKIAESAGVMDRGGLVVDIPRFQADRGWGLRSKL
jgi:hypothetical protein